jgi:predicted SnoaL-like aldol condensation-catalyzing enzyme
MINITIKYFLKAITAIIICAGSCNAQLIANCTVEECNSSQESNKTTEKGNLKSLKEQNKSIALGFYQNVVNAHNVEAIHLYASDNYLEHQYDTHFDSDLKGVKKAFKAYFTAFPDMHIKVNFIMVDGDLVTTQITTTGTNTGPIYGHKPTNKKIVMINNFI